MPNAANLLEAVGLCIENLQLNNAGGVLKSGLADFNDAWTGTLSVTNPNNRTVLDWIVPLRSAEANAPGPAVDASMGQIADINDPLTRMLYATNQAVLAGRITSAQGANVLTAYNTYIAQF